jgi:hypothetical protein
MMDSICGRALSSSLRRRATCPTYKAALHLTQVISIRIVQELGQGIKVLCFAHMQVWREACTSKGIEKRVYEKQPLFLQEMFANQTGGKYVGKT